MGWSGRSWCRGPGWPLRRLQSLLKWLIFLYTQGLGGGGRPSLTLTAESLSLSSLITLDLAINQYISSYRISWLNYEYPCIYWYNVLLPWFSLSQYRIRILDMITIYRELSLYIGKVPIYCYLMTVHGDLIFHIS